VNATLVLEPQHAPLGPQIPLVNLAITFEKKSQQKSGCAGRKAEEQKRNVLPNEKSDSPSGVKDNELTLPFIFRFPIHCFVFVDTKTM